MLLFKQIPVNSKGTNYSNLTASLQIILIFLITFNAVQYHSMQFKFIASRAFHENISHDWCSSEKLFNKNMGKTIDITPKVISLKHNFQKWLLIQEKMSICKSQDIILYIVIEWIHVENISIFDGNTLKCSYNCVR